MPLRRAVSKLLDNAIDYSPTGGRVTMELRANGPHMMEISVRDHGLPDYAEDKVFERLYSPARPHSQKKSTGLGLAFVKEIASLHGGKVTLRNAGDGVGAVTTVAVPQITAA